MKAFFNKFWNLKNNGVHILAGTLKDLTFHVFLDFTICCEDSISLDTIYNNLTFVHIMIT